MSEFCLPDHDSGKVNGGDGVEHNEDTLIGDVLDAVPRERFFNT